MAIRKLIDNRGDDADMAKNEVIEILRKLAGIDNEATKI